MGVDRPAAVVKQCRVSHFCTVGGAVAQPNISNRTGLVVVHGIGDPPPGEALRELTDGMEAQGIAAFDAFVRERRLTDPSTRDDKLNFFPVHLRTGVLNDTRHGASQHQVIAAEVFWGSASQLAPGKWGVLQGTVSLLLNVPTLVMGARGDRGFVSVVSWWASMLLASAAFALNGLLMLTLGLYIVLCHAVNTPPGRWEIAAPLLAAGATFAFSRSRWLWFKEACLAFRVVGIVCLLPWLFTGRTLQDFARVSVSILGAVILAVALMMLAGGIVFVTLRLARRSTPESVTAMLSVCLQFGLWMLIVPLAWQGLFAMIPDGGEQQWMTDVFGSAAASNGVQWLLALVVMAAFAMETVVCGRAPGRPPDPASHSRGDAVRVRDGRRSSHRARRVSA
jgi:hypothetical protein